MARVPKSLGWLFPEVSVARLDAERDAEYLLARILERGRLDDVRWCIRRYGLERIHHFLRNVGHPELSARTLNYWRVVLRAKDERWATSPSWRRHSGAPWPA
ncbi:MAG: hypothetical protein IT378_14560 [Sandaracinaceae bacterium]|nr:hypothetical protein [Sandaracinaceae bacterium]